MGNRAERGHYDWDMAAQSHKQCQWKGPWPGQWGACDVLATHRHVSTDETEAALDGLAFCGSHACPQCELIPSPPIIAQESERALT